MARTSTVLIAGATGFVGRSLAARLAGRCRVIGLTRSPIAPPPHPGIEWRRCDLFSLLECEAALDGADQAVFLVHSMLPSAPLTQGAFQDLDLVIADNFARAAAQAGVRQIVYLGGLTPDIPGLSSHLVSRLEVEETLRARGVPVTTLRAGLIVGAGGSSFEILVRLVRRLRVIPCARWARTPTQPIALGDVLDLLAYCLDHPGGESRHFDVGCREVLSYRRMLERVAALCGLPRTFLELPLRGTRWCRYWVAQVTGVPPQLVGPLLESLRHPMVVRDRRFQEAAGVPGMDFDAAVRAALTERGGGTTPAWRASGVRRGGAFHVRSVQRLPLPAGRSARWAAEEYSAWLPRLLQRVIRAETDAEKNVRIVLVFPRITLLEHQFARDRSQSSDRQVFYITGGLLARKVELATQRPRLEFRELLHGSCLILAIHDYRPRLPWRLYELTQARVHVWVARRFARHLAQAG